MKPTCKNLRREQVRLWIQNVNPNTAWISISEPEMADTVVNNPLLDKLPHLKISFWDLTSPVPAVGFDGDDFFYPPTERDASQIVAFIEENRGKHFLVNCQAGKSRSGAICQFLQDHLGYEWTEGKDRAKPNKLLYDLMVQKYNLRG